MHTYILRLIVLLLLLMYFVGPSAGKVCKWVDEDGRVHYGDCPPGDSTAEQIEISPGPAVKPVPQATQSEEKPAQTGKLQEETVESESKIQHEQDSQAWVDKCFSTPSESLGGEEVSIHEPVATRPLAPREYRMLSGMFRTLAGRGTGIWDGDIEEVICHGTERSPRRGVKNYEVVLRAERSLDNILTMEADISSAKTHRTEFLWLLLKKDWLRFGDEDTGNRDLPRWDIEILYIGINSLSFMRKFHTRTRDQMGSPRGAVRRLELRAIKLSGRSLVIREWFYAQGTLDRMRTWELMR